VFFFLGGREVDIFLMLSDMAARKVCVDDRLMAMMVAVVIFVNVRDVDVEKRRAEKRQQKS
jgi:hypothetical protein